MTQPGRAPTVQLDASDPKIRAAIGRGTAARAAARKRFYRIGCSAQVIWVVMPIVATRMIRSPNALLPFLSVWVIVFLVVVIRLLIGSASKWDAKNEFIKPLLSAAGLRYRPVGSVTAAQLDALHLFASRARNSAFSADDEISVEIRGVTVRLQELHTTVITDERAAVVNLMQLEFNKYFRGHTVIWPRPETSILRRSPLDNGRQVTMESAHFERAFVTFSTDDQQARYILTPRMQELLFDAQRVAGQRMRVAFAANSMFVAAPGRDRFEESVHSKIDVEWVLDDLNGLLSLADRLIDVLDLDLRIWTRE